MSWGIGLRVIVAVLPFGITKVAATIIGDIAGVLRGTALPANFWALVATEVVFNVLLGLITRAIDYSDSLLANRYTQYVSVRVMKQAARLDLTTYEDPVFYDRLERARVQATDRLAMIQQMGRLLQQVVTTAIFTFTLLYYSPWLVLLLIVG
ncbi:MAG: ABC transporter ATP-binding protein, partial [Edaphobacter sp.]